MIDISKATPKARQRFSIFNKKKEEPRNPVSDNYFPTVSYGTGMLGNPSIPRLSFGTKSTFKNVLYTRISIDASQIKMVHARVDDDGYYMETIDSELNHCLTEEANIDQSGRELIQDAVLSMLDEGAIALVPTVIDTDDISTSEKFKIYSIRVGKIVDWLPEHVVVDVYEDRTGTHQKLKISKNQAVIVTNPFYSVMNETNSTMDRLTKKLKYLDILDADNASGKFNLVISLPYAIRTEKQKEDAQARIKSIEDQLAGSKYGIAYLDATEHITQINRAAENNLLEQVKYFRDELFTQIGMTDAILNGTADENAMSNYYSRIIEPIIQPIVDKMNSKWLTKTARSQHQAIVALRDPFKLLSLTNLANATDKFSREEAITSNEIRQLIGRRPSDDPRANELRNKNLSQSSEEIKNQNGTGAPTPAGPPPGSFTMQPLDDTPEGIVSHSLDELMNDAQNLFGDVALSDAEIASKTLQSLESAIDSIYDKYANGDVTEEDEEVDNDAE